MVQVDVFWSYGIGAGMAVASAGFLREGASRYLQRHRRPPSITTVLHERSYRDAITFLAIFFAPSGIFLLTAFPSWETMHVARGLSDLPAWLVTLFALTNITQGIAGYKITEALLARGRPYLAYLQWVVGYLGMFFILVHGWDGTGYMRFFSARPGQLADWSWASAGAWMVSDVGLSLGAIGLVFIPALLALMVRNLRPHHSASAATLVVSILGMNVVVMPLMAVLASLCVRALGPLGGLLAFAAGAWLLLLRPGALLHRHCSYLMGLEPLTAVEGPRPVAT
ncbi:MAG TPA: hypothetical protein ENK18_15195 [Deltaproteobacteria bacterium]|nr:hypothetical protein [Deltaproteobacteria bacterium]